MVEPITLIVGAAAAIASVASALTSLLQRRQESTTTLTITLPDGRKIDLPPEKFDEIVSEASRSEHVPDSGTTRKPP
jgi:hypothetical protein